MTKARILALDLDGPVLDVKEKYCRCYADLVRELGGTPLEDADFWTRKRSGQEDRALLAASGIEDRRDDYRRLFRERIESTHYLAFDTVWRAALQLLHTRMPSVLRLLVTLRHSREALDWQLERLHLESAFDLVLSAPAEADRRVETKVSLVREALGNGPLSGFFIGDTETDVAAGRALGLTTVAVGFGLRAPERLKAVDPDVLLETPGALERWGREVSGGTIP